MFDDSGLYGQELVLFSSNDRLGANRKDPNELGFAPMTWVNSYSCFCAWSWRERISSTPC